MPQICLEYTNNINDTVNYSALFHEIHQLIHQVIGVDAANCKSRAKKLDSYYIGNGDEKNAFIYITIALMPGKTLEEKQTLTAKVMERIKYHYPNALKALHLQLIVYIEDLSRETYYKYAAT